MVATLMPSSPAKHLLQRRNMGQINAYVKTKTKIALTARSINNDFPAIYIQYLCVLVQRQNHFYRKFKFNWFGGKEKDSFL